MTRLINQYHLKEKFKDREICAFEIICIQKMLVCVNFAVWSLFGQEQFYHSFSQAF